MLTLRAVHEAAKRDRGIELENRWAFALCRSLFGISEVGAAAMARATLHICGLTGAGAQDTVVATHALKAAQAGSIVKA